MTNPRLEYERKVNEVFDSLVEWVHKEATLEQCLTIASGIAPLNAAINAKLAILHCGVAGHA